ncbi:MAG TPA: c-type cytochrome [Acidobacteriaceae bacterium]
MTRSLRLLLTLSLSAAAFAQAPTPPPGGQARRPIPPPSNLKVLPRDLTGPQVVAIMRGYERQLGVECEYCHATDPATGRHNFASDANPMKDRARVMIKMTATINADFLTQLTDPKPATQVECGTCHRGMSKPPAFVPKPEEHGPRPTPPPPPTPQ